MQKHSLIRTIYLYLFALVGLVLIIIAAVDFIDMGLKAYVFTQAEANEKLYEFDRDRPYPVLEVERTKKLAKAEEGEMVELTAEEREALNEWLADYEEWEKEKGDIDYVIVKRHEDAARNLAMLIVGIPLYLYHWTMIKKDIRKRKKEKS